MPSTPLTTARVLVVQATPVPQDLEANLAAALGLLAANPDADLAVFPELFLTGYSLAGIERLALEPDAEPIGRLRAAAAQYGTAVVIGFAERIPGRFPGNSALCLDERGQIAGIYRKVHLFGAEVDHFTAGEAYPLVGLLGRRVAPLICYDLEFPEPARTVATAGAELLVTISANMEPFGGEHDLFARARAVENRLAHVYVNRTGAESGWVFVGGSQAVDPSGRVLAVLGREPQVRLVEVPIGARFDDGELPDYLADRRPDIPAVEVGFRGGRR